MLLFSLACLCLSATPLPDTLALSIDCDYSIDLRSFDTEQIEAYKNDADFYYDRPPPSPTVSERFWLWFYEKFGRTTAESIYSVLDYLIYGLVLLTVVLVISRLMKADVTALFYKPPPKSVVQYQVLNENIHELDFEQAIQEAIAQGKYRRATRLYYLKTLKMLADKGHIHWKANKTNRDYAFELASTPLGQPFSEVTYLFDYTWYGNFPVDAEAFALVQRDFKRFQELV